MNKYRNCFKSFISMILLVILIGGSFIPVIAQVDHNKIYSFSGGEGSPGNPYLISTAGDLLALSEASYNGDYMEASYKLTEDIDLGENPWTPIANKGPSFGGIFDGNGKKITIRKVDDAFNMGLFESTDRRSIIKNLIVNGQIIKTVSANEDVYFGLIVARGEGSIENCITEGKVDLTVKTSGESYLGGATGRYDGSIDSMINKAILTVNQTGGRIYLGGISGLTMGNEARLSNTTNQANIMATFEGEGRVGGLAGFVGFDAKVENLLNLGKINLKQVKATIDIMSSAGGIVGEIRDTGMEKALNKGDIYFEYSGPNLDEEIMAGGVAGLAERVLLKNVGNEGNLETKGAKIQHVIGITKPGRETRIENAYSKGKLYGSTSYTKGDIYAMGLGESVVTNNFYFSGSVRLKVGKKAEVNGDGIANIRPGDKTSIYNYCYWNSKHDPFPGYPTFNKPTATSKAMNISTGKLSGSVSIGGKQYDNISLALNGWVNMQGGGYLKWTDGAQPVFKWTFGYQIPDFMKYINGRDGKWLSTSNWAYEWMDKADKLSIIPDILLDQDMTKGISRKEFSALGVKLYEHLKGSEVNMDIANPFTDVNDPNVTKAYALGIVSGIGNGLFAPEAALTREQASTMLTRVYKAVYWEGWTLEDDTIYDRYVLDTSGVTKFEDDSFISGYARDSVYFMAKNGIIAGLGNNIFGPAPRQEMEANYGRATREQAFKIALSMIERFIKE